MYKILPLILLVSTLVACTSNEKAEAESTEYNKEEVAIDSTTVYDSLNKRKEIEYVFIEDYAALTTKPEIIQTFGKENVVDGSSWYAEGTIELKHTVVTNPKNDQIIKYVWNEEDPKKLNSIEACYYDWTEDYEIRKTQKIESKSGVFTGMPINLLRDWNQADFTFSGFSWDYEGGIFAKEGSRIAKCPVRMKLGLVFEGAQGELDALMGDIELSTKNELVKKAPIIVERLYYNFED